MKHNFHKGDYNAIYEDLKAVNWNQLHDLSTEDSWNFFQERLQESVEKTYTIKEDFKKETEMDG